MRSIIGLCLITMAGLVFAGCGGKDDPKPSGKKINLKVTVTVNGSNSDDQVDIRMLAANHDASQYGAPVWKLNGTVQGNEHIISLDHQDFSGATKTYVMETVKAFDFGQLSVGVSNDLGGTPISVSYKVEQDGKVETSFENVVVAPDQRYDKQYTYQAK
ncbi:hypothetical protein ACWKWU_13815 [Chitinophaga lutea]